MESIDRLDTRQQFEELQIESENETVTLKGVNL